MKTQGGATDEALIRAVVDGRAEAIGLKDPSRVLASEAPGFVSFNLAPPLVATGVDAKGLKAWFDTWQGPIGYETRDLTIAAGADVAFCHSLDHMTGTKSDGEKVDLWFRRTLGLRRIGGAWKLTHEHESVPFHMDGSMRAALDLRP
jgi:ketosteroid isomerase-like protein